MTLFRGVAAAAACLMFSAASSAQEEVGNKDGAGGPAQVMVTEVGPVLATEEGLTLYTYREDEPGVSNCTAVCAEAWPPFAASADAGTTGAEIAGKWSMITREDGSKQWAYNGDPLYTWVEDQQPGDVRGADIPEWQVAKP